MVQEFAIQIHAVSTGSEGHAGIGVVLEWEDGRLELSRYVGRKSLPEAEVAALLAALEEARERGAQRIRVETASRMLLRLIGRRDGSQDPSLQEKVLRACRGVEVRLMRSPRRSSRRAEELARLGSRGGTGSAPGPAEELQVSAGGVVYRRREGRLEICLVAKRRGAVWAFPKGRVDHGEQIEETARREILEETGHLARVEDRVGVVDYHFRWRAIRYYKVVHVFLMELEEEHARVRDGEVDGVEWVEAQAALERITHRNEREILREALRRLEAL